ncbi:7040_t:CDS:2 [Funneliformis mosseae]|uniref:7040_t:CDS:1 n=1 Tax=Funneliformis mosseae TaxID=27381 RepID=A0A9N8YRE2_FUNMO|nr:7040_t:CDS:2 [Funneliformis mosseae]
MGKSAKSHKRLTRKERKVQAEISNNIVTSKSASQDPLNSAKPSATTKVTKIKRKKKVQAVTTDVIDDEGRKNERDYVDVFTGKKSYKPLTVRGK